MVYIERKYIIKKSHDVYNIILFIPGLAVISENHTTINCNKNNKNTLPQSVSVHSKHIPPISLYPYIHSPHK